jgi:cyclic beta-1,2-glucan synthetase
VTLAISGWLSLPGKAWIWTLLTVAAPAAYLFTDVFTGFARGHRRGVMQSTGRQFLANAARWFLSVVFLLSDAVVSLDAIIRTLWRLSVSRRRLLEWTSAAHVTAKLAGTTPRLLAWRSMWATSAISAFAFCLLVVEKPAALLAASPLLLLWFAAPEVAAWVAQPTRRYTERLGVPDRLFLRSIARRTWLFFETFVGPDDNWLPPDNFQEDPRPEIAHRTSPTNIGMYLLSTLGAWDLGYIGTSDLSVRIESTCDTLDRLQTHRGHFLNWYETRTLSPLDPRYVSTVDSGNLAVCLVTLARGCEDAAKAPMLRDAQWAGLDDTLQQLVDALETIPEPQRPEAIQSILAMQERARAVHGKPEEWHAVLSLLVEQMLPDLNAAIGDSVFKPSSIAAGSIRRIQVWLERSRHHLLSMQQTFETLLPWHACCDVAPDRFKECARALQEVLPPTASTSEIEWRAKRGLDLLQKLAISSSPDLDEWVKKTSAAIGKGSEAQHGLQQLLKDDAQRARTMAFAMDFKLLFDAETRLFHIGYNVGSNQLDPHFYDLLASEARLASYFAVVKRDVPAEHWFFLGRPITKLSGEPSLLSWNGSMFEYLMPRLLLRSSRSTLLARSEYSAVGLQQRYAHKLGLPWGVSESGYGARDAEHHYQYRAFGVPGLGLRRGLAEDLVVAPYATALALAVRPAGAVRNLQRLSRLGLFGSYGFVDAGDFTPERVAPGQPLTVVRAYMAHHQGMAFAAITNALANDIHARRFSSDMVMRTGELLLQERIPSELPPELVTEEEPVRPARTAPTKAPPRSWRPQNADAMPQIHMLGNGRFASWISESGGGGLWWHRDALTRWQPDGVCEHYGLWVFIHDTESGDLWSAAPVPAGTPRDEQVTFHPHMAEFHRRDHGIATRMEVVVAPSDDLEIRRITLSNESDRPRSLRITSYGEVVLGQARDDERHPAFSKLFVGCEHIPALNGLLFTRRSRGPQEHPAILIHRVVLDDFQPADIRFDADRATFLKRHGNIHRPRGATEPLDGRSGWTLDPIMSLQMDLQLKPREILQFAFVTVAAGSRESAFEISERYATFGSLDWVFNDAAREATKESQTLDIEPERLPEFQRLASLLLAPQFSSRTHTPVSRTLGQPRLWTFGISGDLPILLLRMGDPHGMEPLRTLLRAFSLWRKRLFAIDLVILRTGFSGYEEPVREKAFSLIRDAGLQDLMGRNGGIHLLFADQLVQEDKALLEATANIILDETAGSLSAQIGRAFVLRPLSPLFEGTISSTDAGDRPTARPSNLQFDNGLGGFSKDDSEYVIHLEPGKSTPVPWCNILANDRFGTLVSESGLGFTWGMNSGEFRLTPWSNDPVVDPAGEALYLRDEETTELWTPTPTPAGAHATHTIRHGMGYTHWQSRTHALDQSLTVFVAPRDSLKVVRLRVSDLRNQPRRITATFYVEWIMGALRSISRPHVSARYDAQVGAILAVNSWNPEFQDRVAFLASSRQAHSITTDRREFLGRNGDVSAPSGLLRWDLGGCVASAGEACGAYQVHLDLTPGGTADVLFFLGDAESEAEVSNLLSRWKDASHADKALEELQRQWTERLSAVEVRTPDPAFDLMINRWLLYQAISSRILARSGFYQSGGAIGFRDQLQDVLAILLSEPARARAHILECAARQFEEGDVLHWWHPPHGRGVRTRCSDDLLWLPFVTSHYVEATGDVSILDERIPFLVAPVLSEEESDRYGLFGVRSVKYPLFEHCLRALEKGVTYGAHGLPLIGAGDWNDGMNRVGSRGRGESVWLGWFAVAAMQGFADLALRHGQQELAATWKGRSEDLRSTVERIAWDGNWYARAFDDDGSPWGSHSNDECRIDSIAQSWSALAGARNSEHVRTALDSARRELLSESDGLVRLLTPPFNLTRRDPGYIKAYPPGVRENGGQYSHAAAWLGHAFAKVGDADGAQRVFDILNPIKHTQTPSDVDRYRAEPYVLAADIAGEPPYVGRAGWTWYTGAAAWTWRLGVECMLGLTLHDGAISLNPCLPAHWGSASATIRGPSGNLQIMIDDPDHVGCGDVEWMVDGKPGMSMPVPFPTDGSTTVVRARIRPKRALEPALAKTA